ncbi:putative lipid-binding protein AIR1B [Amaranthus tricolor]|uniref:putative lipid-binding protein AIR1B n=1 Tax=Amaranthus tricolor TaxID=29722 RepID=UPI00258C0245|nr:putative lipid-binding protein AIR1B [Amaranthus tricolor]XP_057525481.1 putative lipid-binding protein AIR1B [Amaranthus tricolor]
MATKIIRSSGAALFLALNLVLLFNVGFSTYIIPPPIETCPPDTLKLSVCADVLDLVHLRVGSPKKECCELIGNLIKADAAACLCTAIHANILDIVKLNLHVDLSLLVNRCDCKLPSGFKCAPHA